MSKKLYELDVNDSVSVPGDAPAAHAATHKTGGTDALTPSDVGAVAANSAITGATKCKVTYDAKGLVTAGADLTASDIPALAASKITSGTFADERIASAATWNGKQNAITSSSKLSSDLVDDADKTNKFITAAQASAIVANTAKVSCTEATVAGFGFTKNAGTVTSVSAEDGLEITGTATTTPKVGVDSTHKLPTTTEWGNKQDAISDLATIRSGAAAGATAYQKPSGGIPKTDLTTAVQTSLGLADNAVQKESGKGLSTNDYTTAEKNKLAGVATGAEVNVQSDWSVTDTASDAYIANKPTIPAAPNNGTLTIKQGTTSLGTFTANQSGNTTVTIPTPTAPLGEKSWNIGGSTATVNASAELSVTTMKNPNALSFNSDATTSVATYDGSVAKTLKAGDNVMLTASGNVVTIASDKSIGRISAWTASTAYAVGAFVMNSSKIYECKTAHTSGASFDDTEKAYWNEYLDDPTGDELIAAVKAIRLLLANS